MLCETYQLAAWTVALNLPGYEVSHCVEDAIDGVLRLSVIPKEIVDLCPDCGRPCNTWHQKRWLENILEPSFGGTACASEGPCVSVRVRALWPDLDAAQPDCRRRNLGDQSSSRAGGRTGASLDVVNAAAFFGIPEKTLERWYYDYVERQKAAVKPSRSRSVRWGSTSCR